jgi:hypothetical protein
MTSSSSPGNADADALAYLFASIFRFVQTKLGDKVPLDEISRVAKRVLHEMQVEDGPVTWADAIPRTINTARWIDQARRPVRIVGHVAELQDPCVTTIPTAGGVETVEAVTAKIVGVDHEQLRTLDIIGRGLIEKVQAAYRSGRLHEFLGLVLVVPSITSAKEVAVGAVGRFYFLVSDLRPATSAFDLLGATQGEREAAGSLLTELRAAAQPPLTYMFDELATNLGIVALHEAPHLFDVINVAILQAVSTGAVGNAPARLHVLLIGPPGVGKKLAGLCARALNPVCQEASASKISAAGLVGASYQTADGWRSTPGLLPLAAEGVLVMQDAHALKGARLEQLTPIFQELLEDGEVRDSVAGGRKRVATTATLIDLNRSAQVQVGGVVAKEAALLGVLPLLSREDVILEIPVSPDRSWAVGERMYRALGRAAGPLEEQPWARRLRLLVALLRDEHPLIDTSPVASLLEAAHREIRDDNADFNDLSPTEASAIPVRMAVSFTRLVMASSRAHDRSYATSEDVDATLRYVRMKVNFMRRAAKLAAVPVSECPSARRAADENFWERRAGTEASASDLRAEYEQETGSAVSVKTIVRELHRRQAANVSHGRWRLSPAGGGER